MFIRLAIEYAVNHYISFRGNAGLSKQYATSPIDAFAKLVEQMVLYETASNDEDNNSAKVLLGTQILSIIVLCMAQRHETEQDKFSQKPFLRMLSGVMMNICKMDAQGIEPQLLIALGYVRLLLLCDHIQVQLTDPPFSLTAIPCTLSNLAISQDLRLDGFNSCHIVLSCQGFYN